ncbi:hypothetical protein HK105_207671 [Polyrhizophydium stewartii]|uniref:Uncharacterized protein n=1 Tax=Polyrhizophydium stewartii TaxID=2732419 RepID=A0ABR4N054_9FUNG
MCRLKKRGRRPFMLNVQRRRLQRAAMLKRKMLRLEALTRTLPLSPDVCAHSAKRPRRATLPTGLTCADTSDQLLSGPVDVQILDGDAQAQLAQQAEADALCSRIVSTMLAAMASAPAAAAGRSTEAAAGDLSVGASTAAQDAAANMAAATILAAVTPASPQSAFEAAEIQAAAVMLAPAEFDAFRESIAHLADFEPTRLPSTMRKVLAEIDELLAASVQGAIAASTAACIETDYTTPSSFRNQAGRKPAAVSDPQAAPSSHACLTMQLADCDPSANPRPRLPSNSDDHSAATTAVATRAPTTPTASPTFPPTEPPPLCISIPARLRTQEPCFPSPMSVDPALATPTCPDLPAPSTLLPACVCSGDFFTHPAVCPTPRDAGPIVGGLVAACSSPASKPKFATKSHRMLLDPRDGPPPGWHPKSTSHQHCSSSQTPDHAATLALFNHDEAMQIDQDQIPDIDALQAVLVLTSFAPR